MSHRTVSVPNLDENHTENGYSVTLSREDYLAAIDAGESKLGAAKVGGAWYYKADETDEVYRLTADEVAAAGVGETDYRGWDYSLWCSSTGRLVKRPSKAVREALGIDE